MRIALIIGSAPDAVRAQYWPRTLIKDMVVINNAWRLRDDWDYLIHPDDFPPDRMPPTSVAERLHPHTIITAKDYVPIQNNFGGFVYAGATMAFTTGYWALGALEPDVMAFIGCDMQYESVQTHFYGTGRPDPLRPDITLQSLEAKSARLMVHAADKQCLCLNLSELPVSRQIFPRADWGQLAELTPAVHAAKLAALRGSFNAVQLEVAQQREADLGYFVASGRYSESQDQLDAAQLRQLDALWLGVVARS